MRRRIMVPFLLLTTGCFTPQAMKKAPAHIGDSIETLEKVATAEQKPGLQALLEEARALEAHLGSPEKRLTAIDFSKDTAGQSGTRAGLKNADAMREHTQARALLKVTLFAGLVALLEALGLGWAVKLLKRSKKAFVASEEAADANDRQAAALVEGIQGLKRKYKTGKLSMIDALAVLKSFQIGSGVWADIKKRIEALEE